MTQQRGGTIEIRRSTVRTRDTDEAHGHLQRTYVRHRASITRLPSGVDVTLRAVDLGVLGVDLLRLRGVRYRAVTEAYDQLVIILLTNGRMRCAERGETRELAPGAVLLCRAGHEMFVDAQDCSALVVRLPQDYVRDQAVEHLGLGAAAFRLNSATPISPARQDLWRRTAVFLRDEVDSYGDALPAPTATTLSQLAAGVVLSVFSRNGTARRAESDGAHGAATRIVGQAGAVIEAHLDELRGGSRQRPMTVRELSARLGISPRGLQAAFRRQYDTTPAAHLRLLRLQRAHRDLQVADPRVGETVHTIGRRWGFVSPSTFELAYRRLYGQSPQRTVQD